MTVSLKLPSCAAGSGSSMPKAGGFDYPYIELDDAIERIRKIRENAGGRVASRAGAIAAMTLKEGGQANRVLGSLSDYGLAETGAQQVRISDLGDRVLFGEEEEKKRGRHEALMRVALFRELESRYGKNPTDEQIRVFLRDRASMDQAEIAEVAADVGKIFKKNSVHIVSSEEEKKLTAVNGSGGKQKMSELKGVIEIRPARGLPYIIPLDDYDVAKQLVESILAVLKKKAEAEQIA